MKLYFCPKCNEERPTFKVGRSDVRLALRGRRICIVCRTAVQPARNKYNAKPAMGTTGKLRHSTSEAAYEGHLAWMAKLGEIEDLRLSNDAPRETYDLEVFGTPAVRELMAWLEDIELEGQSAMRLKMLLLAVHRSLVKIATYTPDFSYRKKGEHQRTVADTKGYVTADFTLKRKLMRAVHGIDVEIVKVPRRMNARRSA